MAEFLPVFEQMILDEGGYILHEVKGDTGGMTYAGIARNKNPHWAGWAYIDRGETPPSQLVRDFYYAGYWLPIRGDELSQGIAENIFNFAVNSSMPGKPKIAVMLAQIVVGTTPDGALGPKTVAALNTCDTELFKARYALAKIARYRDIVRKDKTQLKFLMGWINRTLERV
jgi:lysozyme family protein